MWLFSKLKCLIISRQSLVVYSRMIIFKYQFLNDVVSTRMNLVCDHIDENNENSRYSFLVHTIGNRGGRYNQRDAGLQTVPRQSSAQSDDSQSAKINLFQNRRT